VKRITRVTSDMTAEQQADAHSANAGVYYGRFKIAAALLLAVLALKLALLVTGNF
jgi:hypothetical protein